MTSRAEFLTNLRLYLDDTDAENGRWTDTALLAYLGESVKHYSKLFPRRREQEFVADGTSTRFPVPDDLIDRYVHHAFLSRLGHDLEIPNLIFRLRQDNRYFEVVDDQVVFGFLIGAGEVVRLRYSALHTLPSDDVTNSTVPSEDEDLIYLWAAYLAWRQIGGNDAALSRWTQNQKRDDSPLLPHHIMLERQYRELIKEKKLGGRFLQLVRAVSRNRVGSRF